METIESFLSLTSGSGSSHGSGSGSGHGSGYGSGDGSSHGSGSGSGDGSGSGHGSGYGHGSGHGSGDGYGDNLVSFKGYTVHYIDGLPTLIYTIRGNVAKGATIGKDLVLTECYIAKLCNCFAHGVTLREAVTAAEQKALENTPLKYRIAAFKEQFKSGKQYPASDFYKWHTTLTGSCDYGKQHFVKNHDVDLDGQMTVEEFVDLCRDSYGGDIIQQLLD